MAGRALLLRAEPGFSLPAYERFEPPPPPSLVTARIEAGTNAGELVLDLFGRGGWIARTAVDKQRKAISMEATALDRLLAEVVLRPPDLRHLDAAISGLAASARRESSVKASITDRYASRCATCDRPVILDELTWTAEPETPGGPEQPRPIRKHYRCPVCRDQLGGGENRTAPLDEADIARALSPEGIEVLDRLVPRFPVLDGGEELPDELLSLHTTRQLVALASILERIDGDLRAPSITAAMRLALLHALAPASRLATSGGRVSPLRIAGGHVRLPASAQWRERNPWLAFEDGVRLVRGFVQRLESGIYGPVPARVGEDLRSLEEGSATAMLKQATPAALGALGIETAHLAGLGIRPRVRLVLGTPPTHPSPERVAWAYHATAWILGRDAASTLPLEPIFGPAVRGGWAWQAAFITHALRAVEPVLARDARTVLLLEGDQPEALVAAVLGGISAGYRLAGCRLPEVGRDTGGAVELVPPGSGNVPGGPRTRANVALPPVPGGAGHPDTIRTDRIFAPPEVMAPNAPFSAPDAERAVLDAAVDVLKMRGEPVPFAGLLGEILVGLDRAGHLRRLVRPRGPDDAPDLGQGSLGLVEADHVDRLLALIRGALAGTDGNRLVHLDGDAWWLGRRDDREAAAVPLADRVEWAVFSLLSTSGPLSEAGFLDRITSLFAGPDLPDEALVRACLDSYRSLASTPDRLATGDDLVRRSEEHGRLIATLVDLGHRLGFACWIGGRQQSRRIGGRSLADRLTDREIAGPPSFGRLSGDDLEDVDVVWYVRGKAAFLWEVEWTAMLGETVARRHARMPPDERLVRFLVVLPERVELLRHKLERSPVLRADLHNGGWHLFKTNHLRGWAARDQVTLSDMEPMLGLDPDIERTGDQLALFG